MMIILERFVLYVTGLDLTQYEVEIPSSDPEVRGNTNSKQKQPDCKKV